MASMSNRTSPTDEGDYNRDSYRQQQQQQQQHQQYQQYQHIVSAATAVTEKKQITMELSPKKFPPLSPIINVGKTINNSNDKSNNNSNNNVNMITNKLENSPSSSMMIRRNSGNKGHLSRCQSDDSLVGRQIFQDTTKPTTISPIPIGSGNNDQNQNQNSSIMSSLTFNSFLLENEGSGGMSGKNEDKIEFLRSKLDNMNSNSISSSSSSSISDNEEIIDIGKKMTTINHDNATEEQYEKDIQIMTNGTGITTNFTSPASSLSCSVPSPSPPPSSFPPSLSPSVSPITPYNIHKIFKQTEPVTTIDKDKDNDNDQSYLEIVSSALGVSQEQDHDLDDTNDDNENDNENKNNKGNNNEEHTNNNDTSSQPSLNYNNDDMTSSNINNTTFTTSSSIMVDEIMMDRDRDRDNEEKDDIIIMMNHDEDEMEQAYKHSRNHEYHEEIEVSKYKRQDDDYYNHDYEDEDDHEDRHNEKENEFEKLQRKIKNQSMTINSQRDELKRYNLMVKKYREKVREKNTSLVSMEKIVNDLQHGGRGDNEDGHDGNMHSNNCDNCDINKQEANGYSNSNKNNNKNNNRSHSEIMEHGNMSHKDDNEERNKTTIIQDLYCEIRTYKQIISSLTDENNKYRSKEMEHLQCIVHLENEVEVICSKTVPDTQIRSIENELEMKNSIIEDMNWKIGTMEEEGKEYQVQVSELRQRVLQLEGEVNEGKNEKLTLEKLLSHSRGVASAALVHQQGENNSYTSSHDLSNIIGDKSLSTATTTTTTIGSRSDNCHIFDDDAVMKSLKNELEATKEREQDLRDQLTNILNTEDNNGPGRNSIMETVTESQQEAILYLTGEIESLRSKMKQEQDKQGKQHEEDKANLDLIKSLQQENRSFASESLKNENLVKKVEEDLSLKLGQNACLRDEVFELEEKLQKKRDEVQKVGETITQKELEYTNVLLKLKEMENLPVELAEVKQKLRQVTKAGAICSMTDETVVTIDLNGKSNKCLDDEELSPDESASIEPEAPTSRLIVLKKAMRRDYEKKLKVFKRQMQKKDLEMEELKRTNNNELKAVKAELNMELFNRIKQESLVHQDLENLQNSIKERDHELFLAKQKIHMTSKKTEKGVSWDGLSDTLIDGVGATVEMFESMSWIRDKKAKSESSEGKPSSYHLSSKSFG